MFIFQAQNVYFAFGLWRIFLVRCLKRFRLCHLKRLFEVLAFGYLYGVQPGSPLSQLDSGA